MELEVLTARKVLAADFTGEMVRCRERVGGQRDYLNRIGVCRAGERDLITLKSKEIHVFISTLCLGFFSFELILIPGVSGRIRFLGIIFEKKGRRELVGLLLLLPCVPIGRGFGGD